MFTREEFAAFILRIADGNYSADDWMRIVINHYSDRRIEDARRQLVRYVNGYPLPPGYVQPPEQANLSGKELLVYLANELRKENGA